jgi:hypothetical protein
LLLGIWLEVFLWGGCFFGFLVIENGLVDNDFSFRD